MALLRSTHIEALRFLLVGTFSTACTYLIYFLCLFLFNPSLSYFIGYVIALLLNYFLSVLYTFRVSSSKIKGIGFVLCHGLNLGLSELLLKIFISCGVNKLLAPLMVLVICVPTNFFFVRLVMKHSK